VTVENYFNYFTEIEECFRRCRGTPALLSTLDWALIESWKEAGIPLEAALAGIERSFEKFAKKPRRFTRVNGLAYCSQAILTAAEELKLGQAQGDSPSRAGGAVAAPFANDEICAYLNRNAEELERAGQQAQASRQLLLAEDLAGFATALRQFTGLDPGQAGADSEELERRLSVLEEKVTEALTRASALELLADFRRGVERGLARYCQKMSAAQIDSLLRQLLKKRLFEHYKIPRLSLFYL